MAFGVVVGVQLTQAGLTGGNPVRLPETHRSGGLMTVVVFFFFSSFSFSSPVDRAE
jgi:hypothetical protein